MDLFSQIPSLPAPSTDTGLSFESWARVREIVVGSGLLNFLEKGFSCFESGSVGVAAPNSKPRHPATHSQSDTVLAPCLAPTAISTDSNTPAGDFAPSPSNVCPNNSANFSSRAVCP